MIICIPKETSPLETRVAATPDTVKKYLSAGAKVRVETSAGLAAGFTDEDYRQAGVEITAAADIYGGAEIILKIWAPSAEELKRIPAGAKIIANFTNIDSPELFATNNLSCFALEQIPRISKAQSMDILSSQSNLAGYRAVLEAVNILPKAVPLLMTSAGTVTPAKVLVLGLGVAGLQAIATAKRLGALVYASDIRAEALEQAMSLGAKIVKTEELDQQLSQTDILITAAVGNSKKVIQLINNAQLAKMPLGSVAIDLAAGNIEGALNHQNIQIHGVRVVANNNLAALLPNTASRFYAQNLFNFLSLEFDFADTIIRQTCLVKDGKIYQEENK